MVVTASRAVRFDRYGDRTVLYVADVPMPAPEAGEVVVEVKAAAINPGESAIRSGALQDRFPATFPSGEGSDLAGIVSALGSGVDAFAVGDAVLGFSFRRSSHATYVAVPTTQLIHETAGTQLGGRRVALRRWVHRLCGRACRRCQGGRDDRRLGGCGRGRDRGGPAVGTPRLAGPGHCLQGECRLAPRSRRAIPVPYGDGLQERLREAAGGRIDGFIDLFGPEYLDLAIDLGVPRDRIETIASFAEGPELGVKAEGERDRLHPRGACRDGQSRGSGAIEIPIAATYPLDRVADAYAELEQRHTRGKIVLIP